MSQKKVNRKLSCIFSTDVVGYSRLMEEDETSTVRYLEENKKLISKLIEEYAGRVVDSPGDNLLAEFGSAVKAVECAVEVQEKLKIKNDELEENKRMQFRIGINIGDVIEEDGRLYGSGVNIAARLEGLARPGEIYVSRNVFDQVKIGLSLGYEYLGEHDVKNLSEPVRVYRVLTEDEYAGEVIGEKKIIRGILQKIFGIQGSSVNKPARFYSAIMILILITVTGLFSQRSCQQPISELPSRIVMSILPFRPPDLTGALKDLARGLKTYLNCRLTECASQYPLQIITLEDRIESNIDTDQGAIREFGVNLLLAPTLEKISEKMVRISYLLIDAKTQEALRSYIFTDLMDNRYDLEDELFASVLRNLGVDILPEEESSTAARETQEPDAYEYFRNAVSYLEEYQKSENVQTAIELLQYALEKDPKYAIAHATLGEARWRLYTYKEEPELLDEALSDCYRALAQDSNLARGYCCLGTVFNGKGEYEKAVGEFQRAIKLDLTGDEAIQGLGMAYKELEKFDEAEETYRKAIKMKPEYWVGYNNLGSLYYEMGHYNEAAENFIKMTKLVPDHHYGYSNLGGAYIGEGRYSDAIPVLERSIEIRKTEKALSNLGTAYFYQGRFSEAAEAYEKAKEFNKKHCIIWGNLGDALYADPANREGAGEAYQEALKLAYKKLEVNPRNLMLLSFMAYYHAMVDEREEAQDFVKQVLAVDPQNPAILFNLALTYYKLGDTDQTLYWLKKALEARWSKEIIYSTPLLESLRNSQEFKELIKDY